MRMRASGASTIAARRMSVAYCPAMPISRRARERPTSAPGLRPSVGGASSSSPGMVTTPTPPPSAGIVHPPLEDHELQGGHDHGHDEQPHRVHGTDTDVVGADEPVDLEN